MSLIAGQGRFGWSKPRTGTRVHHLVAASACDDTHIFANV
jgi:hypothetical protein